MLTVALKMIRNNRTRFVLTIVGFVVAVMVLLLGLYYKNLSKTVIEENINDAFAKKLVVLNEVDIPLVNYSFVGDDLVPTYENLSESEILSIIRQKGVSSANVKYLAPDDFSISTENVRVRLTENYAVNTSFESTSEARAAALKNADPDHQDILAGTSFSGNDPYEIMLSEAFTVSMGWTPEEAVGKSLTLSVPGAGDTEMKVVGVFSYRMTPGIETDISDMTGWFHIDPQGEQNEIANAVLFDMKFYETLAEKTGKEEYKKPSDVVLSMEDTSYIEDLIGKLEDEYSLEVQSDYMELMDPLEKQAEFTWVFIVVGIILALLVLIMVINSICINIHQQKRFSNLLALLGYSRQKTCRLFAYQSLIYGLSGSLIGAVLAYLLTTFIGMRMYSALGDYGFSSSELMLPLHYVFFVMCMFALLSFSLGYIAAEIKVKRR
ncbi:MAG: hypothetical protein IK109_09495 [Clostridiales bacterium]|nr:hypothetical protein [Clostridiales bacterium]